MQGNLCQINHRPLLQTTAQLGPLPLSLKSQPLSCPSQPAAAPAVVPSSNTNTNQSAGVSQAHCSHTVSGHGDLPKYTKPTAFEACAGPLTDVAPAQHGSGGAVPSAVVVPRTSPLQLWHEGACLLHLELAKIDSGMASLVMSMLQLDPQDRVSAAGALKHSFLAGACPGLQVPCPVVELAPGTGQQTSLRVLQTASCQKHEASQWDHEAVRSPVHMDPQRLDQATRNHVDSKLQQPEQAVQHPLGIPLLPSKASLSLPAQAGKDTLQQPHAKALQQGTSTAQQLHPESLSSVLHGLSKPEGFTAAPLSFQPLAQVPQGATPSVAAQYKQSAAATLPGETGHTAQLTLRADLHSTLQPKQTHQPLPLSADKAHSTAVGQVSKTDEHASMVQQLKQADDRAKHLLLADQQVVGSQGGPCSHTGMQQNGHGVKEMLAAQHV